MPAHIFQMSYAVVLRGVKFKNFYDIYCPYLHLGHTIP